jgi:hypothetical protein
MAGSSLFALFAGKALWFPVVFWAASVNGVFFSALGYCEVFFPTCQQPHLLFMQKRASVGVEAYMRILNGQGGTRINEEYPKT